VGTLIFGPAYLIQNQIRRRRGTFVAATPKTVAEKASSDARFLRVAAIAELVIAAGAVAVALTDPGVWLPSSGWTPVFLLAAAFSVSSAPYLWALAAWRAHQRACRWAWTLTGGLDVVFGVAAVVIAITNQRSHWIGGGGWTVSLVVLGALWLVGAPGSLLRARA
jgi:hypothetical protein